MSSSQTARRTGAAPPLLAALLLAALAGCRSLPWDITDRELGLPEPRFSVVEEKNVKLPTRDGVLLAADLYKPWSRGAYPTILVRTPYDKRSPHYGYPVLGGVFASQGYVVMIQDVRGKFKSQGEFYPLVHEAADGADTIQWIARQPWSDGRIGMFGVSYFGSTEWLAAPAAGPALRTIVPIFSSQSGYDPWFARGVLKLSMTLSWHYQNDAQGWRPIRRAQWRNGVWTVPLTRADQAMGALNPIYEEWLRHPVPGPFWQPMGVDDKVSLITIPVLSIAGWYDPFLPRMLEDYRRLRDSAGGEAARQSQLIIGPWTHTVESQFRDFKTGPQARFLRQLPVILRWYDHWLKGEDNGVDREGPVRIFVMGRDQWRAEREWPLARTLYTSWYLHSGGSANGSAGDGQLDLSRPRDEPPDSFLYDPLDPVPTLGLSARQVISPGPKEQFRVERRRDVLVYTSPAFSEETEITGPVRLVLYAASSAPDTDFRATLVDLMPDGRPVDLCTGIVRARYRDSLQKPSYLEPGTVYRYQIEVGATSIALGPGHRLRLYVASSDFTRCDRNLNTREPFGLGQQAQTARQSVFHNAAFPSRLVLPVVPAARNGQTGRREP
jgi:putative CocE/NonD family hydrolase